MHEVKVVKVFNDLTRRKRAVGYARVSTADEHQDSSYRLQISELENSIRTNPHYEFIGIFKDRKSASNIKGRSEFKAMIDLALIGEIDVIVTKSITRFARNIIDAISLVRKLKLHNVEVYFQKENISTLDPSIEMILTILAMHAEEELKNISENTKWTIKRKMKRGGNFTTYLYGYDIKGESWDINEQEATVVRLIYDMYIAKRSYREISDELLRLGIKTPTGNKYWSLSTIEGMVQNEKYAGHMALGKSFIYNDVEIHSSRLVQRETMIRNHHEPIISEETFLAALNLRQERSKNNKEGYVPLKDRVTPYFQFVYSKVNKRYLRYVLEKPKGKYEIPTLFCYNNERTNRVMITVNNLFAVLNKALNELSVLVNNGYSFSETISDALTKCEKEISTTTGDKSELLHNKIHLIEAKKLLPIFTRKIKEFKQVDCIDKFKALIRNVIIEENGTLGINLGLVKSNLISHVVFESDMSLKVGNKEKAVHYFIAI